MVEDKLEKLREEYVRTEIPSYLAQSGWFELKERLNKQEYQHFPILFGRSLMFATVILLLATGTITAAQAAKPGNVLYPVKLIIDDVTAKITGMEEIKVENRANEVIDLSKNSSPHIDEATKNYREALDKTKENAQKTGKEKEFKQVLEHQEEKFHKAQENNPSSKDKLKEVIVETQKAKGEVEGVKDNNSNGRNHQSENQNDHQNNSQKE